MKQKKNSSNSPGHYLSEHYPLNISKKRQNNHSLSSNHSKQQKRRQIQNDYTCLGFDKLYILVKKDHRNYSDMATLH